VQEHGAEAVSPLFARHGIVHRFDGRPPPALALSAGAAAETRPLCHHGKQVHGTTVVEAGRGTAPQAEARTEADGVLTTAPATAVGVRTADCLPVLLAFAGAARGRSIGAAAVHAGWRGLTAGILGRAVAELTARCGVPPAAVLAAIGPAISRASFEIGPEVAEAFASPALGLAELETGLVLSRGRGDRWHADLALAAVLALRRAGIDAGAISLMRSCTKLDARWFSYRREGQGVGSNWAWVRLPEG
jgi:YfiH family protein